MKNLYDVLEVSQSCTKEALDASYHRLVAEQDRLLNSNAANASDVRFRLDGIKHAYSILSDPAKRMDYDDRLKMTETVNYVRGDSYFDDFFSSVLGLVRRPLIVVGMLTLIPFILYITLSHGAKKEEIKSQEVVLDKALNIVDASFENERRLQDKKMALENERLQREVELLRMEQERRDKQLEYDRELRARKMDLLRQEQERKDRRLKYEANVEDRKLDMEERRLDITEKEIRDNRKTIDEHNNRVRVERNVNDIYRTIEIQRNTDAARLGITREQYDRLMIEKNYYNR